MCIELAVAGVKRPDRMGPTPKVDVVRLALPAFKAEAPKTVVLSLKLTPPVGMAKPPRLAFTVVVSVAV